jgi:hypothetical protein
MNDEPPEREPMNNELERKPTDRARARLEALLKANAAPQINHQAFAACVIMPMAMEHLIKENEVSGSYTNDFLARPP